ncbi:MAG: hypothetical protein KDC87_11520, partial [Planctomycetes bacterium]|nr:hypothetical protein [Planctomycetota bacterium]
AAFAAALDAFTKIPLDSKAYFEGLPEGIECAREAGDHGMAARLLEVRWRRDGGSAALLGARLEALLRAGDGRGAVALARQQDASFHGAVVAFGRTRGNFGPLMTAGSALLQDGESTAGLWVFELLAEAYPGDVSVLANLALTERYLGRVERAERHYRDALQRAPNTAWVWNHFGLMCKGIGKCDAAADALLRGIAVETTQEEPTIAINLGVLFQRTGNARGRNPVADLAALLRRTPQAPMARRLLLDCWHPRGAAQR